MAPDPRFFQAEGPFALSALAEISGAAPGGANVGERAFTGVAPLETAGPEEVSFLDNKRYLPAFEASRAGACIVEPRYAERAPEGMALLTTDNPYRAYALVARAFHPPRSSSPGIHPTALVDPAARLDAEVTVGPYAVIEAGAEIGAGCEIAAHALIGAGVVLGSCTRVGHGATLSHCILGARCQIHPGVRIGSRGFGFTLDPEGYLDVPQLGRVILEDEVEVGANSTIDRGAGPDTVIGAGSKIDNLIQIGHNVQIGRGCVLVAQSGVAGSSKLEDYVMVGAQGGIAGHLTIGKGAQIAAQSGVMRDVPAGLRVCGAPAIPIKEFFRLVNIWQKQIRAPRKSDE